MIERKMKRNSFSIGGNDLNIRLTGIKCNLKNI